MTVPTCFNSSFRYLSTAGVTDVADIITDFESEVVTNGSPAWTNPGAGLYQTPVDANGRWFDVLLTAISGTNLECRVRNWSGTTIGTRRMQISGTGTTVLIFSGQYHFHIEALEGTPEHVCGGMLDLSPEAQDSHSDTVYAGGFRTTGDATDNYNNWDGCYHVDGLSRRVLFRASEDQTSSLTQLSGAGSYIFHPAEHRVNLTTQKIAGRRYQHVVCSSDLAVGSEIDVPIDTGVTGTFKVSGMGVGVTYSKFVLAIRKA